MRNFRVRIKEEQGTEEELMQKISVPCSFCRAKDSVSGIHGKESLMRKIFLVYVRIAEICDTVLHEVCGTESAVEQSKAELLKEGYRERDISVDEVSVRY